MVAWASNTSMMNLYAISAEVSVSAETAMSESSSSIAPRSSSRCCFGKALSNWRRLCGRGSDSPLIQRESVCGRTPISLAMRSRSRGLLMILFNCSRQDSCSTNSTRLCRRNDSRRFYPHFIVAEKYINVNCDSRGYVNN
jgi:hypothetical protein